MVFYTVYAFDISFAYFEVHPICPFGKQLIACQNSLEDPNTPRVTLYHRDSTKCYVQLELLFATLHLLEGQLNSPLTQEFPALAQVSKPQKPNLLLARL